MSEITCEQRDVHEGLAAFARLCERITTIGRLLDPVELAKLRDALPSAQVAELSETAELLDATIVEANAASAGMQSLAMIVRSLRDGVIAQIAISRAAAGGAS